MIANGTTLAQACTPKWPYHWHFFVQITQFLSHGCHWVTQTHRRLLTDPCLTYHRCCCAAAWTKSHACSIWAWGPNARIHRFSLCIWFTWNVSIHEITSAKTANGLKSSSPFGLISFDWPFEKLALSRKSNLLWTLNLICKFLQHQFSTLHTPPNTATFCQQLI